MEGVDYQAQAVDLVCAQASSQTQATWQMYLLLRLCCYHGSQQPIRVARPVAGETASFFPLPDLLVSEISVFFPPAHASTLSSSKCSMML